MIRFVNLQALLSTLWVEMSFSFNVPIEHSNGNPWLQMRVSSCNLLWWLEVGSLQLKRHSLGLLASMLFLACLILYDFETLKG